MIKRLAAMAVTLTIFSGTALAGTVVLYNGLSRPSQTPSQQGWTYLHKVSGSPAPTATATVNGTVFNSGFIGNHAGYFKSAPFALDRTLGYSTNFRVQINAEAHNRESRAGFSLIVMSKTLSGERQPFGIELGFWQGSIWAQSADFKRSETVAFNTGAVNNYVLSVKGDRYQLFANGSVNPILQGVLRQYTGYNPPAGYVNPYNTPNLIFMGDNTTSAAGKVTIAGISVSR